MAAIIGPLRGGNQRPARIEDVEFSGLRIPVIETDEFTGFFVSADTSAGSFIASIGGSLFNVILSPST